MRLSAEAPEGQGAAEVKLFAQEGAKVVFGDVLDDLGMQVEAQVRELGGDVTYLHLDVRSEEDWAKALQTAEEKYGKLNVLVNNAGLSFGPIAIEDTTVEDWDYVMDVNLKGVFLGTKTAIPALRQSGRRVHREHLFHGGIGGRRADHRVSGGKGRRTPLHQGHCHTARQGRHTMQLRAPRLRGYSILRRRPERP